MSGIVAYQVAFLIALVLVAFLGAFYLRTKRRELVQKALEIDAKMDRIQAALSRAAAKLEWIGLKELAECGHLGAAIALDDLVGQLEYAVKLASDKASLIKALTPCCVNMVALSDEYPELLTAIAKTAVKEPMLLAKIKELQAKHDSELAKAEREAENQKAFQAFLAEQKTANPTAG